jgi:hypothetical protein
MKDQINASVVAASVALACGGCTDTQAVPPENPSADKQVVTHDTPHITSVIPQDLLDRQITGTELDALKRMYGRYPNARELQDHRDRVQQHYKSMLEKYPLKGWK